MGRDKIPVAVAGATGVVGRELVRRLARHPWFELVAVAASERSAGRTLGELGGWVEGELPPAIAALALQPLASGLPARIVFSALDAALAARAEEELARAGVAVVSNASAWRMDPRVPLLIPEVNPDHLRLLRGQEFGGGAILTNPNCCVVGLAMVLKPLHDAFGVKDVMVTTFQAVSGAGYPGVPCLDLLDNVVPYIPGEEEKIQEEPAKILGRLGEKGVVPAPVRISAQAVRVPVRHGHTLSIAVQLGRRAALEEVHRALEEWRGATLARDLPSAPVRPLEVRQEPDAPQPLRHRDSGGGMVVTVGRLRSCPVWDLRLVAVVHNAVRGAAGAALLNAELLVKEGLLPEAQPTPRGLWVA